MPKKSRKKGKTEPAEGATNGAVLSDPADEAMSTASHGSLSSEQSLDPMLPGDGEEAAADAAAAQMADQEQRLLDAIDAIIEKSLKERIGGLKALCSLMRKSVLTEFITDSYYTIMDSLERCLKKGKGEEQTHAASALILLCVQLGITTQGETTFQHTLPTLLSLLQDPTASLPARAQCAEAIGLCAFIAADDLEVVADLMSKMESIFIKSYLKGDKTSPVLSSQTCNLHKAALEAWCLLLTMASPALLVLALETHLHKLPELLESSDLDIRIAGGEAISLLYELARNQNEDFQGPNINALCEKLQTLSTENNKHQNKKNRKQQRSSFRDILNAIENEDFDDYESKFGVESVCIDSWAIKCQYDSLCSSLGTGMSTHLKENALLRDIFDLGAPLPVGTPSHRPSKHDKKLYNQAVFKARTQVRQKQRDKRSAQLSV